MTINEISINSYIRGYFDEDAERKYREFKVINILSRLEEVESEEGEIFYIDDCEGIPLTEEILKANFKQGAMDNFYYAHRIKIHIWGRGNVTYTIRTADLARVCVDYYCQYVHQLQHALRLCDLNNLADNFKIE